MTSAQHHDQPTGLEIAIVGMAGRFPGAADPEAFWQNLRDGVESVRSYTDEELLARSVPPELVADPDYVKTAVSFEGADLFDAGFFGYTPREAERLDPQHRIFLECAWEAMENAGYDTEQWPGAVAVFAGAGANVYLLRHLLPRIELDAGSGIADLLDLVSGNGVETLCTRVAYKLGLRGPAATVQTACSTSLMAVHLACQSLLANESDMALAGGVTLNLMQSHGYRYQAGAIFSPDGHCRAFDAQAGGTMLGSGAGVVVLKRLEDALRDGDHIHAVIRATAANNDAADKIGFTAPSVNGQAAVIRAAHVLADVTADSIGYVEAHGTGTSLGDPIEVAALTQAFRIGTERKSFCALGSVKTNIGHLDCAAGVAGLIKTALALKNRMLPASLHFEQPNPRIDFAGSPFFVNAQTRAWDSEGTPRRAGVSGFGIGGTNVHAVLEEAPTLVPSPVVAHLEGWQVLPVSASSAPALKEAVERLAGHLRAHPEQALTDVAHTLQVGRRALPFRVAVTAKDHAGAVEALTQLGAVRAKAVPDTAPEVVFLFPGAGSQHAGMGAALYGAFPAFRQEVDRCLDFLRRECDLDLRPQIFPVAGAEEEANRTLARMEFGQTAQFVVSYAAARLWMSLGVKPAAMLGHSLGEYVAACVAGVFSLEDALRVVVERARLQQRQGPGAMTSVLLSEAELQPFLGEGCELAVINGEQMSALSGPIERIEAVEQALTEQGHVPRRLHVAVAAHSAMTEPIMGALEDVVAAVARQAPQIPFASNVSGKLITAEEATSPRYWAKHLRSTVRFLDGLDTLLSVPGRVILEVGSSDALTNVARQHAKAVSTAAILSSQAHARQYAQNAQQFGLAAGALWAAGVAVDWTALAGDQRRCRIPLPTYPFQHRSYWLPAVGKAVGHDAGAFGRRAIEDWFHVPVWRRVETLHASAPLRGCSIVLVGSAPIGNAVASGLVPLSGGPVVTVEAGPMFGRLDTYRFQARAAQKADIAQVLKTVAAEFGPVVRVLHLWSLDEADPAVALETGLMSVMALAQALSDSAQPDADTVSLMVVSDGMADVTGGERVSPEKATLLGFCKVLSQELPFVRCRVVDVPAAWADAAEVARAGRQIGLEAVAGMDESIAAYRGAYRWLKGYEPVARPLGPAQRLRKRGVYLITGGLGGVGMTFARHLAQHWQARLVLLTHTPLPQRTEWDAVLAATDGDAGQRSRLGHLLELEALGAEVAVIEADVTNAEGLRQAVRKAADGFGAIHGAIHTAGRAGGGLIALRERSDVEKVLAPKLQGTQNLLSALAEQPLDFVVLCSALTAIVGGFGQADYAAANSAMDAIAAQAAAADYGCPVISVNWDVWRDLGMAAGQRLPDDLGIETGQGGELLERILAGPQTPQLLVSSVSLERQSAYVQSAELAERLELDPDTSPATGHPRPELDVEYIVARDETERALAAIWSDLLGVTPVGIKDNLFDLGGNSLLAVQILSRVRSAFRLNVSPSEFFRSLTVEALAALVRGKGAQPPTEGAVGDLVPVARVGVQRPSPTQQRIWVFERLAGSNAARSAYNETLAISLEGPLEIPLLQEALRQIVQRHEILRTAYPEDDQGDPIATIDLQAQVPMKVLDLADVAADEAQAQYRVAYDDTVGEPFDLARGPLLRATLVRFAADKHVLIVAIHHIVFDGWSTAVLANELCEGYQALREGRPTRLPALPVQYADYAHWHERKLAAHGDASARFWREQLAGAPLQSTVPHDMPRPKAMQHRGATVQFGLDPEFSAQVRATARAHGVSAFTVLLGAFLLVLHRRLGRSDVVVGTDVAGRTHADLERLIGFFVNVVPVRSRLDRSDVAVRQWLVDLQASITAIFDHQDLPLDRITSAAKVQRSQGGSPLVQILFVLQNTPQRSFELDGLAVDVLPQSIKSSKFDMAVFVFERDAGFAVEWVYATELYREATTTALSRAWREALQFLCAEPDAAVGDVSIPTLSGGSPMNSPVITASKFDKLSSLGKKASAASKINDAIRISFPSPGRQFPVMIEALDRDIDPIWWATQQRDFIEDKLRTHAGIIFRNFGLVTPQDFERFSEAMEPNLYGRYGDLPKKEGGINTYRSTPYPENQMILYHNECSHTDRWPRKQWFFCELPSRVGGITPIVDGRELLEHLPAGIVEEMERKGLLYVRNFHPKLDVSWQHFFKTEDRAEVEARLQRGGIEWVWLDGDILQTRTRAPAVITHPVTGARAFFNQVQLHHVSCLEPEVRSDLLGMVGLDLMPRHVFFGDGSPISDATMEIIGAGYEACAVRLDWQRGDVVMLDNMLAAHARDPYEEPRKIVVAMGSMYERDAAGQMRPVAL